MKDEYLNMMICAEEDPELYGIVRYFLQHEVSAADRLSVIDRHLCVLSALMGYQGADALLWRLLYPQGTGRRAARAGHLLSDPRPRRL